MRVLVPTMYYPPSVGGVQRVAGQVAANLSEMRVRVICPAHGQARAYDEAMGLDVRRVPVGATRHHRPGVVLFNLAAPLLALGFSPDVVLSPHVLSAGAAACSARLARVPMVQYLHAEEMTRRPGMSRAAIRAAALLVTLSTHTEELARSLGADPEKMRRIEPGTSLVDAVARVDGPPTVITVSRIEDRFKGHDVMIDAWSGVLERVPDARWLVVGDGPLRAVYEEQVRAAGLDASVRFVGQVSDAEREELMAQADVFCMPSRVPPGEAGEGFGIVYLEAGAWRLPVVAGDAGGARDSVRDGQTGLLVDPESPAAVTDALVGLLQDPERRSILGEEGRRWAELHSWPEVGRRMQDVLLEAVR